MEFVFHLSGYDAPGLEDETAELLHQRLEARSRAVVPGMWKVTDRLNARADKGPEKRQGRRRIYGVILIALGVFALVPGLTEPRIPSLIGAGIFAIFAGVLNFCLPRERKPLTPPASCRKEAAELLAGRRSMDWENAQAEVRFDETGAVLSAADGQETVLYGDMTGVFETPRLWLLVCGGEKALLLQKKDLVSGEAGAFPDYLRGKMRADNLPYKGEST